MRFAKVIGRYFPQHEFHFYGDLAKRIEIDDEINQFSNVSSTAFLQSNRP